MVCKEDYVEVIHQRIILTLKWIKKQCVVDMVDAQLIKLISSGAFN